MGGGGGGGAEGGVTVHTCVKCTRTWRHGSHLCEMHKDEYVHVYSSTPHLTINNRGRVQVVRTVYMQQQKAVGASGLSMPLLQPYKAV